MRTPMTLATAVAATLLAGAGSAIAAPAPTEQGPSSSQTPYLVPVARGVSNTSVLTVGDKADNGYRMVGIPDGLGAYDNGDGTFTLVMNHELSADKGIVRAHGSTGAFVSKWVIRKSDMKVLAGEDLIKQAKTWDAATGSWAPLSGPFSRFCSATLADQSAFYDKASGLGTTERIFTNGEEEGAEGRAFAHVVTGADAGTSFEIKGMGKASWENVAPMPNAGRKTVLVGMDDSGGGQVYVYIGDKKATGNTVEKAGLTGGKLFGLKINGVAEEKDSTTVGRGTRFTLVPIAGGAAMTGAELEARSNELGVSKLARPEDGGWVPNKTKDFYFTTTASFKGVSRLWHLHFNSFAKMWKGGQADIALAGPAYDPSKPDTEQAGPRMMDNLTINRFGQILIQEDPGKTPYLSGVWHYDPKSRKVERVLRHDASRFAEGGSQFLTVDEESSGIIEAPFLGRDVYLFTTQAHYPIAGELVEGGQLQKGFIPTNRIR